MRRADLEHKPQKGRGALSAPDGRFEPYRFEAEPDGWELEREPDPAPQTTVMPDAARTVISRNQSPDIPFDQSINPYRGCEHGCVYCLSGDTRILMEDGTHKALADISPGDQVIGTKRQGFYRRYKSSRVLAHWRTIKSAYRLTLRDGTQLICSADHRFLTERGWKFVTGTEQGPQRRPHLTLNNRLMGTGAFADQAIENGEYQVGYLCGMVRGDGLLKSYHYQRAGRSHGNVHQFRLALCDDEALSRTQTYLSRAGVETHLFLFQKAVGARKPLNAIKTFAKANVDSVRRVIAWPANPSLDWQKGYLAGLFDAEGHFGGCIRITNSDRDIIEYALAALRKMDFQFVLEHIHRNGHKQLTITRLRGGLSEILRFFHAVSPAISRKRSIEGIAVKNPAKLQLTAIERINVSMPMYDITTETGDFIANGVISHNCFARPSHSYLGLSPGLDFETRLFYKADAAKRLREELSKPGYVCKPITLGINTDAYQPVEKRLRVTRSILETLDECSHPVSLLTKSALIRRDLDILSRMAQRGLASAAVSLTSLDNHIKRTLEPRTASPAARLKTIKALADAGIPTSVMTAPVIPAITDAELEHLLEAAASHGARWAGYVLLRLPWEVKDLFREWLAAHYPDRAEHVMSLIRQSRGGRDYDARFGHRMRGTGQFAELIAQRFAKGCKRYGLNQTPRPVLDCSRFRPPAANGQLSLFQR